MSASINRNSMMTHHVEGRKNHVVEERGHEKHNRTLVKGI
jgi:hypothetical protein